MQNVHSHAISKTEQGDDSSPVGPLLKYSKTKEKSWKCKLTVTNKNMQLNAMILEIDTKTNTEAWACFSFFF